jgi:hypothetical protein
VDFAASAAGAGTFAATVAVRLVGAIMHGVRSHLSIRGKHLDHCVPVGALVLPPRDSAPLLIAEKPTCFGGGEAPGNSLRVVRMSATALRYVPRPDPDPSLRDRIVALAHRHRRYGAGMIYLKLRQEGRRVNHKRVDRLYAEERLQVRRRRRKKVPLADRQPLVRPQVPTTCGPRTSSSIARPKAAS